MRVTGRIGLLVGALGLAVVGAPLGAVAATTVSPVTVQVHGRLLVVPSEVPGGETSYGVALADGDIVPIRGSFDPSVRTGALFDGRLALPSSVSTAASTRSAALRIVDRGSLTLPVVGAASVTPAAAAATSVVHRQFVAAIDNKGALGQTDAELLAHVTTVGSYWEGQSNGAITGVTVPVSVKHFNTATGTTDCGLGASVADFFNLVQEAAGLFPTINLSQASPDQLVLFVPPSCFAGSTVGRGTVGSTFASGGELVAESSPSIEGVYAHETGHNYGFQHANARVSGVSQEYYGLYDVMGFALPAQFNMLTSLSTPYRVFQGVTDPGEIQDVPLGDQTQPVHVTATIKPRSDATGLRSIRVTDPDTGEALYLDDRSGTGQDTGAFYASPGFSVTSPNGSPLFYAQGVTISASRGGGGVDDLVVDASGDTSLADGGTWTNASGSLAVHVTSAGPTGAVVSVDFTPATQDFTTVGTPVIAGSVRVGGAVTLSLGTWSPAPTTTTIRWTADGSPVPSTDDKLTFEPSPTLVGKHLVATVTGLRSGFRTTAVASASVVVSPGVIPVIAAPSITGAAHVGSVLHGHTATWGTMLSTVTSTWQWRADGTAIPGANALDYTVKAGDVGKVITLAQQLTAPAYQTVTSESQPTAVVPVPVISPAPAPTVSGTPRVGAPLTVATGTWMSGVTLGFQWYAGGVPVPGATSASYTPRAVDLGTTIHVSVTGTRPGYPDVTTTSADTAAVSLGVLTTVKPTVTGKAVVGRTLTAHPGRWTGGTTFGYAWFANGVAIKHATAQRLVLTKAQKGKRVTVKVTGRHPGYTSRTLTSAKTPRIT